MVAYHRSPTPPRSGAAPRAGRVRRSRPWTETRRSSGSSSERRPSEGTTLDGFSPVGGPHQQRLRGPGRRRSAVRRPDPSARRKVRGSSVSPMSGTTPWRPPTPAPHRESSSTSRISGVMVVDFVVGEALTDEDVGDRGRIPRLAAALEEAACWPTISIGLRYGGCRPRLASRLRRAGHSHARGLSARMDRSTSLLGPSPRGRKYPGAVSHNDLSADNLIDDGERSGSSTSSSAGTTTPASTSPTSRPRRISVQVGTSACARPTSVARTR